VAIVSCNDGLRPVVMKIEATDEDAKFGESNCIWVGSDLHNARYAEFFDRHVFKG